MEAKQTKIHRAWLILSACVIINVIIQPTVMTISSLYTVPMYNDLQIPRTLLALQSVMMTVGAVLSAPIWGAQYKKRDARKLLCLCITGTALCTFGRSLAPNIWFILPISFVKGILFTGSTLLPISILLTAWFQEKRGLAVSIATIGTSIGGVILSPVIEGMISTYGWRVSDQVVGVMQFVLVVPFVWFIVRSRPADLGLEPYGAGKASLKKAANKAKEVFGMTSAEARRSPIFYLFLLAVFFMTFANGAALQIPTYLADIGYGTKVAARIVSLYNLVGIPGKLLLGHVNDRFGEKKGTLYVCSLSILAYVFLMLSANKTAMIAMAVFYGLQSGITSMMPTLLTSRIFGNRDYGPIYGTVVSINRFGGIVGNLLVSFLFDLTGNYSIIWPATIVSMILTLAIILVCIAISDKQRKAAQSEPAAQA